MSGYTNKTAREYLTSVLRPGQTIYVTKVFNTDGSFHWQNDQLFVKLDVLTLDNSPFPVDVLTCITFPVGVVLLREFHSVRMGEIDGFGHTRFNKPENWAWATNGENYQQDLNALAENLFGPGASFTFVEM